LQNSLFSGKDWKNSEGNVDNGVVIKLDKRANSVLVGKMYIFLLLTK
jgi:hypothetical protein